MIKVGFVQGWENDIVYVAITSNYTPSFGDILYTFERVDNGYRTVLLEVVGFEGIVPEAMVPAEAQPTIYKVQEKNVVKARLFLEINKGISNGVILVKASRPPSILSQVSLVSKGDADSEEIMRNISEYFYARRAEGRRGVGVVVLRSGIAHNEIVAREKYFMNAAFNLDLPEILRKHILISGQTGSGKTSGIQGMLLKYAFESNEKIGWLVIDRHGEYTPSEGYVRDRFIGVFVDSIITNKHLADSVKVYTFRLSNTLNYQKHFSTIEGVYTIKELPLKASSVTFSDFASLDQVSIDMASTLEEFLVIILEVLKNIVFMAHDKVLGISIPIGQFDLFIRDDDPSKATANALALVPILADNLVRFEGVGFPRAKKKGLHRVLVDRGIDARITRILRRFILSIMNWRARTIPRNGKSITVIDDSKSLVKVSPTLKNPEELACLLDIIVKSIQKLYPEIEKGDYKWRGLCTEKMLEIKNDEGLDVSQIVRLVDEGNVLILDVSGLDAVQADLAVLTIVRRLLEHRLEVGVEESRKKPVIAIVSEEAPLYLSPERVRSPFNPFARIAREGRKFGIGLVAITQLATIIEKQLLANFNTMVVMRTRSRSDLEFFRDLGVPAETLPFLGDRECFIYTPDLPVKEPIPVYMPAWFDRDYISVVEERRKYISSEIKIGKEILEKLE